jgi:hypothetical protein
MHLFGFLSVCVCVHACVRVWSLNDMAQIFVSNKTEKIGVIFNCNGRLAWP